MDINSYVVSSVMSLVQVRNEQAVKISVMKKIMDVQEAQGMALVEMINSAGVDRLLDIYA